MYVHLIFVVKYRKEAISLEMETLLKRIFAEECEKLDCAMFGMKSDGDHVHALVRFPPAVAIATLVNRLKGASSYQINRTPIGEGGRQGDRDPGSLWSPSYFVKTIGSRTIETTDDYIAKQREKPPRRRKNARAK